MSRGPHPTIRAHAVGRRVCTTVLAIVTPVLILLATLSTWAHFDVIASDALGNHARRALQDTMTAIRLRKPIAECGHALHPNGERHLRSRARLASTYPSPLLAQTLAIAERCRFSLDELRYEYPEEIVPAGQTVELSMRAEGYKDARVILDDSSEPRQSIRLEKVGGPTPKARPKAAAASPKPSPKPAAKRPSVGGGEIIDPWSK